MTPPFKRSSPLAIAIPASFVSDIPHLREKTFRIGLIARAAAIFRVDEIVIYPDLPSMDQKSDTRLIHTILSYIETPQYLRRRLFKIVPELQYAGTLPPLRTPHHPTASRIDDLTIGEYREGVVISTSKEDSSIDVGVDQPVLAQGTRLKPNTRVTVRITELSKQPKARMVSPKEIKVYWGYRVSAPSLRLGEFLKKGFDLVIATSRKGKLITEVLDGLKERWMSSHYVLVAFGAPTQGLYDIVSREHVKLDDLANFVVNMTPNQATETVRTEEAVYATLSVLNIL